jgi:ribokinase
VSGVFVVGSINMDVVATADRHPRSGETVTGEELHFVPGGKGANQAVAAHRADAQTRLVGRLGEDDFGDRLEAFLRDEGLDLDHVERAPKLPTGTAVVTVAGSQNTIVVVPGANSALRPRDAQELPIATGDVVVAQFEVPLETVEAAFLHGREQGATTVLNPSPAMPCSPRLLGLADVLVMNQTELGFVSHAQTAAVERDSDIVAAARKLRAQDSQVIVTTLGADGAVAVDREEVIRIEGRSVDAVDSTGAGDCFTGNLAAELSRKAPVSAALETANMAASLCVQSFGAGPSMPRLAEVRSLIGRRDPGQQRLNAEAGTLRTRQLEPPC